MDNPCYDKDTKTSCSKRCTGCSVSCPEWAEYVKSRDQLYLDRHESKRQRTLIDAYEVKRTRRIQKGRNHKN